MAAVRPVVSVQTSKEDVEGEKKTTSMPTVFSAPIRTDVVRFVHDQLSKNTKQAHGTKIIAGHQTSAESWGTGRAVSRIPRVPGGGTHRAGQGAFGNMCRGGHVSAPIRIWRRWHRRVNVTMKRYAVVSAIAASAIPALVSARGHKISRVPELPLVVSDEVESLEKTSSAVKFLKKLGAYSDVRKVNSKKSMRPGKGKMRNRRFRLHKGPLIVYGTKGAKLVKAFRSLEGVDICSVENLKLKDLAPGGTVGRLIIWTQCAFEKLESVYGSFTTPSEKKKGYLLPRPIMANPDVTRVLSSEEVQAVIRPTKVVEQLVDKVKSNPLKNRAAMVKLNPFHDAVRKREQEKKAAALKQRGEKLAKKRTGVQDEARKAAGEAWYKTMISDSDYTEFEIFGKWLGVTQ